MTYGQDVRASVVDDCVYSKGSLVVSVARLAADQDITFVIDLSCQPEVHILHCQEVGHTKSRSEAWIQEKATWNGFTQKQSGLIGSRTYVFVSMVLHHGRSSPL